MRGRNAATEPPGGTPAGEPQREGEAAGGREHAADQRQRRANQREDLADERERGADKREALADERERLADERERRAMNGKPRSIHRDPAHVRRPCAPAHSGHGRWALPCKTSNSARWRRSSGPVRCWMPAMHAWTARRRRSNVAQHAVRGSRRRSNGRLRKANAAWKRSLLTPASRWNGRHCASKP